MNGPARRLRPRPSRIDTGAALLLLLLSAACTTSARGAPQGSADPPAASMAPYQDPSAASTAPHEPARGSPSVNWGGPAPLPDPSVIAQGVSSANDAHLLRSIDWDFAQMRQVFNTVSLLPGDPKTVDVARRWGLAVILEFDYKRDFLAGEDISSRVQAVVDQVRKQPREVAAVHVADRVNEKPSPDESLRYLAVTGGVIHRELPGLPVLVNASDWELTCGYGGQTRCHSSGPRYQYETNATLDRLYRSGYIDGLTVADNLKNDDSDVQMHAWREARARWRAPFLLISTCSQVSFPEPAYAQSASAAHSVVSAYVDAPLQAGADGVALWAWHQLYEGQIYTFLDKDGRANALWKRLMAAAHAQSERIREQQ